MVLKFEDYVYYINSFNRNDEEMYQQEITNEDAALFLRDNIPLFDCPDKDFERTYYFRWWTYRKHIKKVDQAYIITEFLPDVSWALKYNAIAYPFYHQILDGRWLRKEQYIDDYEGFWLTHGIGEWNVSAWKWPIPMCQAIYERALVKGKFDDAISLLDAMIAWNDDVDRMKRHSSGLVWSSDNGEGEVSISGGGFRPAMNAYAYANAQAIAKIADIAGRTKLASHFRLRAEELRGLINRWLWDKSSCFYKTIPLPEGHRREMPEKIRNNPNILNGFDFSQVLHDYNVKEWFGYVPWCFHIPEDNDTYAKAWKQLMDSEGFYAPFGPTTAEQRHPGFVISYEGHSCQWNGPSWPFGTSLILEAMANHIRDYQHTAVTCEDYFHQLQIYTRSHQRQHDDGRIIPWIDENINPYTGEWIARSMLQQKGWSEKDGGRERGKDYNHSHYINLIITGLIGLRPREDEVIEVDPLVPMGKWDYFCMDNIPYHGHLLTILYDKSGKRYNCGKGFMVCIDGKVAAVTEDLSKLITNINVK